MDSDDEILPEARIFEKRIDDFWAGKMEIGNHDFSSEIEEDIESPKKEEKPKIVEKKIGKRKTGKKGKISKDEKEKKEEIKDINDDEDSILDSKARELLREIAAKKQARSRKRRNCSDSNTGNVGEIIKLTAAARRRIRDLEMETAREARRVEEENKLVFAKCESARTPASFHEPETVEDTNREISLKIRYQFKISKVKANEKEEFKSIFQNVANLFGLKPTGILLCLGDTNIKLTDTPENLNIRICDIIDCIPYEEEDTSSSHMLLLKIQSNDTRKKTEIRAHKLEKFSEVMKKYADLRNLPLQSLTFEFDGEVIQPEDTPLDLDMESGSCIDARVTTVKKSPLKKPNVKELKKIPPIPIMDIVEID